MRAGDARRGALRRLVARLLLVLLLVAPGRSVRAEGAAAIDGAPAADAVPAHEGAPTTDPIAPVDPADPDAAALADRIAALEAEREGIRLTGAIAGVAIGVLILQGGLSTIVSTQYNCPGYWNCSDETRWGLTAGSGAAIVVGAITLGLFGPRLSERLEKRRVLRHEIHRLRMEAGDAPSGVDGARAPTPRFDWGVAVDDERQALHATIRF